MTDQSQTVDVNTDDLDAFTDLMTGKAKPAEENVEAPTPEPEVDTPEDEDALATVDADDEPEADKPALSGKKKKSVQERINELTAKAREEREARQELERRLAEFEAAKDPQDKPKPKVTVDPDAPHADDTLEDGTDKYPLGEFDPAFISDLVKYTNRKEREELKAVQEQEKAEKAQREHFDNITSTWEGKLAAAEDKYDDLREKAAELEETFADLDPKYGVYLAETIMTLDAGPDVLYYLATHLDEAERIVNSGATKATIALGRLEARFLAEAEEAEKAPKPSSAPTPPPVLKGSSGGKVTIRPDTDDLEAFEKLLYSKKR